MIVRCIDNTLQRDVLVVGRRRERSKKCQSKHVRGAARG